MSDNTIREIPEATTVPVAPTMEYVLSRIDKIINDNAYIHDAIDAIRNMTSSSPNYAGDSRGEAIADTVQAREMTNQQLIRLLEKMYDDLKPVKYQSIDEMDRFCQLTKALSDYPPDDALDVIQEIAQQIFRKK